jgi:hypothetical protein
MKQTTVMCSLGVCNQPDHTDCNKCPHHTLEPVQVKEEGIPDQMIPGPKVKQLNRLIKAAKAYADMMERCIAKEDWRTKTLQKAANHARAGEVREARMLEHEVNLTTTQVFDFTDVGKELIKAVKPLKEIKIDG